MRSGQVSGPARPPFQASGANRPHQGGSPQLQLNPVLLAWITHMGPQVDPELDLQRDGEFPGRETAWPPPAILASRWPQTIRSSHLGHLQGLCVPAP